MYKVYIYSAWEKMRSATSLRNLCCGRFFFGRMNFILPNEFMEIFCVLFGIWYYFCII